LKSLIQRFPAALLPLLSIKGSETPTSLGDSVQPTLEMLPFYLAERAEVQTISQATVSSALVLTLPVPAGEYWYVWWMEAIAQNITVGSNVQLATGVADLGGGLVNVNSMNAPVVSIAGQAFALTGAGPILLKPGMSLFASTLVDPGAGSLDLVCRGLVARLTPQ